MANLSFNEFTQDDNGTLSILSASRALGFLMACRLPTSRVFGRELESAKLRRAVSVLTIFPPAMQISLVRSSPQLITLTLSPSMPTLTNLARRTLVLAILLMSIRSLPLMQSPCLPQAAATRDNALWLNESNRV